MWLVSIYGNDCKIQIDTQITRNNSKIKPSIMYRKSHTSHILRHPAAGSCRLIPESKMSRCYVKVSWSFQQSFKVVAAASSTTVQLTQIHRPATGGSVAKSTSPHVTLLLLERKFFHRRYPLITHELTPIPRSGAGSTFPEIKSSLPDSQT